MGIIYHQANKERDAALELSRQNAISITRQIAFTQKKIIKHTRAYLQHLATTPFAQRPEDPACSRFLGRILPMNSTLVNIGIPEPDGDLNCNALPLTKKINVSDRGYFQRSLSTRDFAIGEFQHDRAAQKVSVNFSYPVIAPVSDQIIGVAVAVVSLDWWSDQLSEFALLPGSVALIADAGGSVIASFPNTSTALGTTLSQYGLATTKAQQEDFSTELITGSDGTTRIFTHAILYRTANNHAVTVNVGIPFDAAISRANQQFIQSLATLLIAMLLVGLFAIRELRRSILSPLATLTRATESLETGQLTEILPNRETPELALLQTRFRKMAETRLEAERAAINRNNELSAVFKALPDSYFRLNRQGIILDYKSQLESERFLSPEQFVGSSIAEIMPLRIAEQFMEKLAQNPVPGTLTTWNYPLRVQDKELIFEARMSPMVQTDEWIVVTRDITERTQADEMIWRQAHFDILTGLPNRNMLHDRLEQEIRKSDRCQLPIAVLVLDLDRFKEVNDTLGHDMGDKLLKETSSRLTQCVRAVDTIARQGGDEFAIILSELHNLSAIESISEKILAALAKPFRLGLETAHITGSIGITLYPDDATDVDGLLKTADQAMYAAKAQGRNRFHYFTESMQEAAHARMCLINDLHLALARNQFQLHYQPIVCLETGQFLKAEALIRWQHPTRGLISPAEFIPIAEETHMIIDIGNWVFQEATRSVHYLRKNVAPDFQLSVNISPIQFATFGSGLEGWLDHLQNLSLSGEAIVAEITEGLMMDASQETKQKLRAFGEAGIQVALDDFGTGYSSLSYIREYDIDYLKIDRAFIRNIQSDPDAYILCEAIILMARKLGIKVIAEGVETQEQYELLRVAGCHYAQGYLFSRPVDRAQLESLIKKWHRSTPALLLSTS
ncbi:MAG: bifunctional diguanylate cyclase/phosphodiesterase [Pontibacterium sp.]